MDFDFNHYLRHLHYDYYSDTFNGPDKWGCINTHDFNTSILRNVNAQLENKEIWKKFHSDTTEMVITKTGRRMFPPVVITVTGLDHNAQYFVLMEFMPASKYRHKHIGIADLIQDNDKNNSRESGWTKAGEAEPQPPIDRRIYHHPDGLASGKHWMERPISFVKLKLTNNITHHNNNVVLTSMHKYIPRIWIIHVPDTVNSITNSFNESSATFIFPETTFIAVTAYQNENIAKLKINNNPYASGFRETGQSYCKRKCRRLNSNIIHDNNKDTNILSDLQTYKKEIKKNKNGNINFDDNSVNSSDEIIPSTSTSPSLTVPDVNNKQNIQPRLYRPWVDSELSLNVSNIKNIQSHQLLDLRNSIQSSVPHINDTDGNFAYYSKLTQSIEHYRKLNAALWFPYYQYYDLLNRNIMKIYR